MSARAEVSTYGKRVVALLLDWLAHLGGLILGISLGGASLASESLRPIGIIVLILTILWSFGFGIYNDVIRQGRTGQTFGKRRQGIMLASSETGAPPGVGTAFLRWLLAVGFSLVTGGLYIIVDYLAPAFGDRRQRITDRLLSLEVVSGSSVSFGSRSSGNVATDEAEPY